LAREFDDQLVTQLRYSAPAELFKLLRAHLPGNSLDVVDLGCGTGLMGLQVRSSAKRLDGVDISQEMIKKAKERGVYDNLICDELVDFLASLSTQYDLVVSTDVFNYFGELSQVFELVHRNLNRTGLFGFSVEAADDDGFSLQSAGRYRHSEQYLKQLAAR